MRRDVAVSILVAALYLKGRKGEGNHHTVVKSKKGRTIFMINLQVNYFLLKNSSKGILFQGECNESEKGSNSGFFSFASFLQIIVMTIIITDQVITGICMKNNYWHTMHNIKLKSQFKAGRICIILARKSKKWLGALGLL